MVIVLDPNFQPVWVWNSFHWLSTNRLGTDHPIPSDWLHGNSVSWSPEDGDLVVSLRTQDWAIKIDYANGTGNGRVSMEVGGRAETSRRSPTPPNRGSLTSTTCAMSTTRHSWSSMTETPAKRRSGARTAAGRNGPQRAEHDGDAAGECRHGQLLVLPRQRQMLPTATSPSRPGALKGRSGPASQSRCSQMAPGSMCSK